MVRTAAIAPQRWDANRPIAWGERRCLNSLE
jgi:hypothetical protein